MSKNENLLDVADLLIGASVCLECTKDKPDVSKIVLGVLALWALDAKKKGYDFKIVLPKLKSKVKGVN